MKNYKFLKYYGFFLILLLFFAYVNSKQETEKELFTPNMRALYRPHIRNARVITEGLYNKHSTNVSNLFRKFGIM
jgi:hypothetical protein